MTHASWPGPARKPAPRPPEPAALPGETWHAVGRELLGLLATLAVLAGMLLPIEHTGSAGP